MLEKLVEHIVKSLVSNPSAVKISHHDDNGRHIIEVAVSPDDIARIIGTGGRVLRAIRTVVSLSGARVGKEIFVNISE